MTRIKFCGLTRLCDIEAANELRADYIGFVFARASKRYVSRERAEELRGALCGDISAVGVFVDEEPRVVADLIRDGVIDIAQLHGREDDAYIAALRRMIDAPTIQAFRVSSARDVERASRSTADFVLLDSGAGTGEKFDWGVVRGIERPYFLAGGLTPETVAEAISLLAPFAADVSSGIETNGAKDAAKMAAFAAAARRGERI